MPKRVLLYNKEDWNSFSEKWVKSLCLLIFQWFCEPAENCNRKAKICVTGNVCMQRNQKGWDRTQSSLAVTGLSEWPLLTAPRSAICIHHQDPERKMHTCMLHAVTKLEETQKEWGELDSSCPSSTMSSWWILGFISGQALGRLTAGQASKTGHILVLVSMRLSEWG